MNKLNIILGKNIYLLAVLLMGVFMSSCGSYKGVDGVEDGIYSKPEKGIMVGEDQKKETDNFFATELEKYEDLEESDEIILDAEDYSNEEYGEEKNVESNAAWGYDTKEVVVTHHVNYNWYHPYHSPFYYGYNWGYYNNWYFPSYYYRPWGYRNYGYYGYGSYYGGYSPYYYGGYYNPYYYGGYGSYNPYYYGGYGYNAYNHNYTRPYNQYGRRADYGNRYDNRRSLSRSVASNLSKDTKPSLIRGSGTISERVGRRSLSGERTPTIGNDQTRVRKGVPTRDNSSRTRSAAPRTRDNVERNRTTTPRVNEGTQRNNPSTTRRTNTSRTTQPTRVKAPTRNTTTKPSSTRKSTSTKKNSKSSYSPSRKSNSSSGRGYSSGSRGSSSSSGSSSSGSRGSSSSSGSSRGGRR